MFLIQRWKWLVNVLIDLGKWKLDMVWIPTFKKIFILKLQQKDIKEIFKKPK